MLKLTLLLLALLAVCRVESGSLTCPELAPPDRVCADAPEGFSFSDGCNRIRCLAGGLAASSRRQCPSARSAEDRSRCRSVAFAVFDRMPPRACPNAAPETVCTTMRDVGEGDHFQFTDGCNQFGCAADGSVAGLTRRHCPAGDGDSALCQFVQSLNADVAEEGSMRRRRRSGASQEFACPSLAASEICGRSTNGFTYSDGCNTITCHADGTGQTTWKACPQPDKAGDGAEASTAYCEAAEQQMRAKMQRASLRTRCLQPDKVCVGDAGKRRLAFNDGCNRCFCRAGGDAACTRRSCPRVLMTDDEFESYCERRGAGIH